MGAFRQKSGMHPFLFKLLLSIEAGTGLGREFFVPMNRRLGPPSGMFVRTPNLIFSRFLFAK